MNNQKVPKIRFKGFSGDWEQRKFSDIYEKNNERNNGQFGWNRTISTSTMTFNEIGNGAADSSIDNYKILRVGDIAFEGHTNKEFRYGRFVLNDIGDGIMSPRFATLRPIIKQDLSFWKPYIHDERVMRKKLVRSTKAGTMMNELVIDDLMEQLILVPSLQEQKKIGAFFEGLDNLITLHQSKLFEHRKERNHHFMISWEQRKVSDICSISTGKSNTQDKVDDGPYPFYVRSPIIERSNKYLFDEEAVLTVGDGVGTGKVFHYVYGKYDLHQRVYRLFDFSDDVDAKFFYHWFSENFYDRVMSMTAKTSVDSVRLDMIADMELVAPSYNEQRQIADYLDDLDRLITLHQSKLNYYRNRSIRYGSF